MENKYKKTLAKMAAVFSIIAVFSFGFVDKTSYASDASDSLSAVTGSTEGSADFLEIVEYMEEEDDELVEGLQEGVESPYSKEITQDHIDAVKGISGESDDVYKNMINAYEAQEKLKSSLKNHKSQKITDDELKAHKTAYKDAHKEYRDAHEKALPKVVQETGKLSLKCKAGDCTDTEKLQLNKYKLFADASVGDLKLSTNKGGKLELHEIATYTGLDSKLSKEDQNLLKELRMQERTLSTKISLYNSFKGDHRLKAVNEENAKRTALLVKLGIIEAKKPAQPKEKNVEAPVIGGEKSSGGSKVGDKVNPNKDFNQSVDLIKITGVKDDLRITQEDVDALRAQRDALGAEYSKKLADGVNDPTAVDAAEAAFSTSKKLLELQRKLDNAISLRDRMGGDHAKAEEMTKKAEDLQREYNIMQSRYDQLKLYSDSKKDKSPSIVTPGVDPNKNKELQRDKRAQLDSLAKELEDSNGSSKAMKALDDFRAANPEFTQQDIDFAINKVTAFKRAEEKAEKERVAKEKQDKIDADAKAAKAKADANAEQEEDSAPDPTYKEQQRKPKVTIDENGDYIRVEQDSKKKLRKVVVAAQSSTPSKGSAGITKVTVPAAGHIKTPANATTSTITTAKAKAKDSDVNSINLLNEALSSQ